MSWNQHRTAAVCRCLSVYPSVCLPTHLPVCQSVSVHPSVRFFFTVYLPVFASPCSYLSAYACFLSARPPVRPSARPSARPCLSLFRCQQEARHLATSHHSTAGRSGRGDSSATCWKLRNKTPIRNEANQLPHGLILTQNMN